MQGPVRVNASFRNDQRALEALNTHSTDAVSHASCQGSAGKGDVHEAEMAVPRNETRDVIGYLVKG